MKQSFFILFFILITLVSFAQVAPLNGASSEKTPLVYSSDWYTSNFISSAQADSIFKQPYYKKDSIWKYSESGYLRYNFTYEAIAPDSITKRYANLFFSMEQYRSSAEAKENYEAIKKTQADFGAITNMNEVGGEEGILRIDKLNNPLFMVLKGDKLYKLVIRFVASPLSTEELKTLVKKIVTLH
jgi:hypothetical protein